MKNVRTFKKGRVEILVYPKFFEIYVDVFSTELHVLKTELDEFIKYLKYMSERFQNDKMFYIGKSKSSYHDEVVFFGHSECVKHPRYGNYIHFDDMPTMISLLSRLSGRTEDGSIISIIKNIKKIKEGK